MHKLGAASSGGLPRSASTEELPKQTAITELPDDTDGFTNLVTHAYEDGAKAAIGEVPHMVLEADDANDIANESSVTSQLSVFQEQYKTTTQYTTIGRVHADMRPAEIGDRVRDVLIQYSGWEDYIAVYGSLFNHPTPLSGFVNLDNFNINDS